MMSPAKYLKPLTQPSNSERQLNFLVDCFSVAGSRNYIDPTSLHFSQVSCVQR